MWVKGEIQRGKNVEKNLETVEEALTTNAATGLRGIGEIDSYRAQSAAIDPYVRSIRRALSGGF
jgi:hypothetical protein